MRAPLTTHCGAAQVEWNEIVTLAGVFFGGALAAYFGYSRKTPALDSTKHVEFAGALIDSSAVKQLTAAVEAHTLEAITARHEREKERRIGHEIVEALETLAGEMKEQRQAMVNLSMEIARSK